MRADRQALFLEVADALLSGKGTDQEPAGFFSDNVTIQAGDNGAFQIGNMDDGALAIIQMHTLPSH